MADKPLRLPPFTNLSLVLNPSLSPLTADNGVGGQGYTSNGSHGDVLLPAPTSTSGLESYATSCQAWQNAQHTLFQMANLCAAVSLLTPSSFRHHVLFLRCLLLIAYLLFVLWSGLFVCMMDVLVWNCVFFLVDLAHVVCLVYYNIPSRLSPSLNELYSKRLKPLKVSRRDFAELCNLGNVIPLRKGSRYSVENQTPCGEKVSILLQGRLKVTHDGLFLHSIEPNEFVDSPEFDSVLFQSSDAAEKYQVTVTAMEESLVISWLYPSLKSHLASHLFLSTIFKNIIGKDISDKLYRIQELLQREQTEDRSSSLSWNSSLVNARTCLLTTDEQRPNFANAPQSLSESSLSSCSLQPVTHTVETRV